MKLRTIGTVLNIVFFVSMNFITKFEVNNPKYWGVIVLCMAIAVNSAVTLGENE